MMTAGVLPAAILQKIANSWTRSLTGPRIMAVLNPKAQFHLKSPGLSTWTHSRVCAHAEATSEDNGTK